MAGDRFRGLDALRGFAILGMALSGFVPFTILPAWMYHAQVPPPDHIFTPTVAGITWVDLVFPFFLFSMGAAIPIAMANRLDQGETWLKTTLTALYRGLVLGVFAWYVFTTRPPEPLATPKLHDVLALLAFTAWVMAFARWPFAKPKPWSELVFGLAVFAGVALSVSSERISGKAWTESNKDIIILVLANVAVAGALIYRATRKRPWSRAAICAVVLALFISRSADGWAKELWNVSPVPWLTTFEFFKYLLLVLPGTLVGEWLMEWSSARAENLGGDAICPRHKVPAWFGVLLVVFVTHGLFLRQAGWVVLATVLTVGVSLYLLSQATGPTANLGMRLFQLGGFLLLLGLCFEPFEGGIRKDTTTVSYFFVTGGLATIFCYSLTLLCDVLKPKSLPMVVANGMNPILAYIAITHLEPALWRLTGIGNLLVTITLPPTFTDPTAIQVVGAMRGGVETLIVAIVVWGFSRQKIWVRT